MDSNHHSVCKGSYRGRQRWHVTIVTDWMVPPVGAVTMRRTLGATAGHSPTGSTGPFSRLGGIGSAGCGWADPAGTTRAWVTADLDPVHRSCRPDGQEAEVGTPEAVRSPDGPPRSAAWTRAQAANPSLVAGLTQELDRRVHDEDSLLDLMHRASAEAVRILSPTSSAGVTAQFDGDPFTAAHTDAAALLIDEGQYEQADGPCLRAMRTDASVVMTIDAVRDLWPEVADAARSVGVTSFRAEPLRVACRPVGSLNLYSDSAIGLDQVDADLLLVVADFLGQGLTDYSDIRPGELQGHLLRAFIQRRDLVSRAIGVLMAVHEIDAAGARQLLTGQAEQAGTNLASAARLMLAGRAGADGSPAP